MEIFKRFIGCKIRQLIIMEPRLKIQSNYYTSGMGQIVFLIYHVSPQVQFIMFLLKHNFIQHRSIYSNFLRKLKCAH